MIVISEHLSIQEDEVDISAIRAQGAGGQNVNKVSSAIHLRFNIRSSNFPEEVKNRLLCFRDKRINKEGIVVIKAQKYRTQEKNREDALARLVDLIQNATVTQKIRRHTKPTRGSQKRRVDNKTQRGKLKALRRKLID